MSVVPPPCPPPAFGLPTFRETDGLHVGFLGRIVREKGLQHLIRGFRALPDADARLLIGGDYEHVAGGSVIDQVRAATDGDSRVRLLGFVPDARIADFCASLDVFALPSVNAFEAFGIVQVAALQAGVPVLAYGNFITVAVNFVILAFVIFVMVKQINRLRNTAPPPPAATPEDITLLREIRDSLKRP